MMFVMLLLLSISLVVLPIGCPFVSMNECVPCLRLLYPIEGRLHHLVSPAGVNHTWR